MRDFKILVQTSMDRINM